MTSVEPQALRNLKARLARPPMRPQFDKGGGKLDNANMEARIASLETKVGRLTDASQRIETTVAEMSGMLKATLPDLLKKASATDGVLTEVQMKLAAAGTRQENLEKSVNETLPKLATQEALSSFRKSFDESIPKLVTSEAMDGALKDYAKKGWALAVLVALLALIAGGVTIGAGLKGLVSSQPSAPLAGDQPAPAQQ